MSLRTRWVLIGAVGAVFVYAAMWIGYVHNWAWLDTVDTVSLRVFYDFGISRPGWVSSWQLFCTVFGPTGFRVIALVLIVIAVLRGSMRTALFLALSVGLMGLVTETAKTIAGRPRPVTAMAEAASSSFPSGHALGVMVGVLAILTVVWPVAGRLRLPLALLGAVLIVLVGVGRVVLNVHHPSDVVAGWALGFLYYLVCVRLVPPRPLTAAAETPAELDTVR
ncbi:phosphatase PAP2 family protein [Mycobacterium sp. NBC_00419]|uniref:phosphatase PAP2 family protein n=1 Tax=Mycobacterium sp. NBC_00419 TaxID=2975989 RepID=UPI002E20176A